MWLHTHSDNSLGVDGAKALVPALSEMKMLQSLNLDSKWTVYVEQIARKRE